MADELRSMVQTPNVDRRRTMDQTWVLRPCFRCRWWAEATALSASPAPRWRVAAAAGRVTHDMNNQHVPCDNHRWSIQKGTDGNANGMQISYRKDAYWELFQMVSTIAGERAEYIINANHRGQQEATKELLRQLATGGPWQ